MGACTTFRVRATNNVGTGPDSDNSATVVPAGHPSKPTILVAIPGDGRARVDWAPADPNGSAIVHYTVSAHTSPDSPGTPSVVTADGSTTSATITGLTNDTAYTFTVIATNGIGDGPASDPSAPILPHDPPPNLAFDQASVPEAWETGGVVSGSNLQPGATYTLRWQAPGVPAFNLSTVTADSLGSFTTTISVDDTGYASQWTSTAYVHAFNSSGTCVATGSVLLSQSRVSSPVEETLPAAGLPNGAIVRTGEQNPDDPHKGWGRVHVERAREITGGWHSDPVYQKTKDTLAAPDAGYPRAQGTAQKYMKNGWVVVVETEKVDPTDGMMRGIITSRPANPGEV